MEKRLRLNAKYSENKVNPINNSPLIIVLLLNTVTNWKSFFLLMFTSSGYS
jgi:hypothetical protein